MSECQKLIENLADELESKIADIPRFFIISMIRQCFDIVGPPDSKQRELFNLILSGEDKAYLMETKKFN